MKGTTRCRDPQERVAGMRNKSMAGKKTLRGIVHGKTIQLDDLTGFADGTEVNS